MTQTLVSTDDYGPTAFIRVVTLNGVDLASVAANTSAAQDITVTGMLATDIPIAFNLPAAVAGLGVVGLVAGADKITVTLQNSTASAVDAAAADGVQVVFLRG